MSRTRHKKIPQFSMLLLPALLVNDDRRCAVIFYPSRNRGNSEQSVQILHHTVKLWHNIRTHIFPAKLYILSRTSHICSYFICDRNSYSYQILCYRCKLYQIKCPCPVKCPLKWSLSRSAGHFCICSRLYQTFDKLKIASLHSHMHNGLSVKALSGCYVCAQLHQRYRLFL